MLVGALEFRCCWEVLSAHGKLTFDGSIERIKCVTEHEDFLALTHAAVLKAVEPLLKKRDGGTYKQRANQTLNEYVLKKLIIIIPIEDILLISFSVRGNFSISNKHLHFEY